MEYHSINARSVLSPQLPLACEMLACFKTGFEAGCKSKLQHINFFSQAPGGRHLLNDVRILKHFSRRKGGLSANNLVLAGPRSFWSRLGDILRKICDIRIVPSLIRKRGWSIIIVRHALSDNFSVGGWGQGMICRSR